jgi:hypothetical protein
MTAATMTAKQAASQPAAQPQPQQLTLTKKWIPQPNVVLRIYYKATAATTTMPKTLEQARNSLVGHWADE